MSEQRLIYANALEEIWELYKKYQPSLATNVYEFGVALKGIIDNAPSVDLWEMRQEATENALKKAEVLYERPKGEWTIGYTAKQKKVSVCNLCNCISCQGKTNFCHNCGASMKGGVENERPYQP